MRNSLSKEKELRKKGFADKQIEETIGFLRQKGLKPFGMFKLLMTLDYLV
jgi:hypothetical protein